MRLAGPVFGFGGLTLKPKTSDLEDLADAMDAHYRAAQVRPKTEPSEVIHMQKETKKADQAVHNFKPS